MARVVPDGWAIGRVMAAGGGQGESWAHRVRPMLSRMQGETHADGAAPTHRPTPTLMEPHVSTGLFACAVVSTAHWLGAGWVGEMWVGMPLGLWCVGAAAGAS